MPYVATDDYKPKTSPKEDQLSVIQNNLEVKSHALNNLRLFYLEKIKGKDAEIVKGWNWATNKACVGRVGRIDDLMTDDGKVYVLVYIYYKGTNKEMNTAAWTRQYWPIDYIRIVEDG